MSSAFVILTKFNELIPISSDRKISCPPLLSGWLLLQRAAASRSTHQGIKEGQFLFIDG
jgi:hypothetical protein